MISVSVSFSVSVGASASASFLCICRLGRFVSRAYRYVCGVRWGGVGRVGCVWGYGWGGGGGHGGDGGGEGNHSIPELDLNHT